jgi:hypothetical protein
VREGEQRAAFGDRTGVHARGHEGGEGGRRPSMNEEAHRHPHYCDKNHQGRRTNGPASHLRLNPLWVSLY